MKQFVDVLIPPLVEPLSYRIPRDGMDVDVGHRVLVPLGKRKTTGYVISKIESPSFLVDRSQTPQLSLSSITLDDSDPRIKPFEVSPQSGRCFIPAQLEFFKKVADYYGVALSNVIDAAIPNGVPEKKKRIIRLIDDSPKLSSRSKKALSLVEALKTNNKTLAYDAATQQWPAITSVIKKLSQLKIISIEDIESPPAPLFSETVAQWAPRSVNLNDRQKEALEKILRASKSNSFETFLLHGVTGSGKTEVYIEAASQVLALGKSVIIIVPEIALTPQLIDRFRARLGDNIASLHSGLAKRVRWESWKALLEGRSKIAIGARSAIFAPISDIGLIIVDEEHDSSYKQSDGLRYNARDMAVLKGQMHNCPVILGSATPSLESYYRARSNKFSLLSLESRFIAETPLNVEVVDLRSIKPWQMPSANISPTLLRAIEDAVAKREQVFLLYNRRGFASFLQCDACGMTLQCPNCSVTLTYHHYKNSLLCHYCGLHAASMEFCPVCPQANGKEAGKLIQRGGGTEKIFEEVSDLFPDVKVDRLDRDTVGTIDSYKEILNRVRSGETTILVGTQMIAKGHDLPNVTLVGVVDCDVGLHMPDFRAAERSFQLLTQVAGRAGRGSKSGTVILQTRIPHHPSIKKTVAQDYVGFAKLELGQRQHLEYPPFVRLLRIIASSESDDLLLPYLDYLKEKAKELIDSQQLKIKILGPAPAALQKLKTLWRWHLLFKSQSASALHKLLYHLMREHSVNKKIRVAFDVDPLDML